jgi:hypothetical protein
MDRAERVARAWGGRTDPLTIGGVTIVSVQLGRQSDGQSYVDVVADRPASGDPLFRIINPPLLVADPAGEIEHGGRRYREDPLGALAETLALFGGARREITR